MMATITLNELHQLYKKSKNQNEKNRCFDDVVMNRLRTKKFNEIVHFYMYPENEEFLANQKIQKYLKTYQQFQKVKTTISAQHFLKHSWLFWIIQKEIYLQLFYASNHLKTWIQIIIILYFQASGNVDRNYISQCILPLITFLKVYSMINLGH